MLWLRAWSDVVMKHTTVCCVFVRCCCFPSLHHSIWIGLLIHRGVSVSGINLSGCYHVHCTVLLRRGGVRAVPIRMSELCRIDTNDFQLLNVVLRMYASILPLKRSNVYYLFFLPIFKSFQCAFCWLHQKSLSEVHLRFENYRMFESNMEFG